MRVLLLTILITFAAIQHLLAQSIALELDVVTHLNTAKELLLEDNVLYAATSGGYVVQNFTDNTVDIKTTVDGFNNHNFTSIAKNNYGDVVLGSINGILSVVSANGSISNDQNLTGQSILDLFVEQDTLWVLSEALISVYLYNPERSNYQFRESYEAYDTRPGEFYSLVKANNTIYVGSDVGLLTAPANFLKFNLYAISNWKTLTTTDGLINNNVRDIIAAEDGSAIYLATGSGVVSYDFTQFTRLNAPSNISNLFIQNNELYGANTREVYRISLTQNELLYNLNSGTISDVIISESGDVWTAVVKRGIQNLKSTETIYFDGPADNYIGEVMIAKNGKLWATAGKLGDTRNQGVFSYDGNIWENYLFAGGNSNRLSGLNSSNSIIQDADENIWIGSWGGGVLIFDADENIHSISPITESGSVWISSAERSDTLIIEPEAELTDKLSGVTGADGFITVITDIFYDNIRESVWVLNYIPSSNTPLVEHRTATFGSESYAATNWQNFTMPTGNNQIHKMTQDFIGDLWVATAFGVVQIRFDGDEYDFELYNESSNNLKNNNIRSIAADTDGYVWVGTESGLNAILFGQGRQVINFRDLYQPIGLQINDIFIDSNNNRWFASDKGLSVLKAEGTITDPDSWIHVIPFNSSLDAEQINFRKYVLPRKPA